MKKQNFLIFIMLVVVASFISCSSDNDTPSTETTPTTPTDKPDNKLNPKKNIMLQHAIEQMKNVMKCYWNICPNDLWTNEYPMPQPEKGDKNVTTVWPASAPFAGFVALRKATANTIYEDEFKQYDDRMFNSFLPYEDDSNGTLAYNAYPAKGPWMGRYFDDNEWVAINMIDMYSLTKEQRYLDKAKMVWNYLDKLGWNPDCGGGILWREKGDGGPTNSSNTCSTGPAAVLSAKLYLATQEQKYLDFSKKCYKYCIDSLQDHDTHLFWDSRADVKDENGKKIGVTINKDWIFPYNSGTPMQAACLLYKITKDKSYLTEAQAIARNAYRQFYENYYSPEIDTDLKILKGDDFSTHAILMRAYLELYSIDHNRVYIDNIEKCMKHIWSICRQPNGLLNYRDFKTGGSMSSWELLFEGYYVEVYARLGKLASDEAEGIIGGNDEWK